MPALQQNLKKIEKLNKSITIISINYYPEDTSTGLYSTQMAEFLQYSGWDVTVITGFPYYPKWEIYENYRNRKNFLKEEINGVNVMRFKQFVPKSPSFLKRVFHIIDFTSGSYFNTTEITETNIVLSIIPFTSSAWLGRKLARRTNAKHWIHIQDFEFDAAFESGIISKKGIGQSMQKLFFNIESKILNSADLVSTISSNMLNKLKLKSNSKSYYFPNWIDENVISPTNSKTHRYLLSKKFKVLYSGNIGEKQNWNLFIELVDFFKTNNQIEFIVVGNGSAKNKLIDQTKEYKNIKHYDPIPFDELNDLLCSADLHILFQKDNVVDTVMPSKILGMMASEVPSLVTGSLKSEVAEIFTTHDTGYFYKSSEKRELIKQIEDLIFDKRKGKSIGKNARKHVIDLYSKEVVLDKFNKKLHQVNENKN